VSKVIKIKVQLDLKNGKYQQKIIGEYTTNSQRLSNIFVVVSRMVIRFMNIMSAQHEWCSHV
jgi:hypothetical protein